MLAKLLHPFIHSAWPRPPSATHLTGQSPAAAARHLMELEHCGAQGRAPVRPAAAAACSTAASGQQASRALALGGQGGQACILRLWCSVGDMVRQG
jgi:hypothetical protein